MSGPDTNRTKPDTGAALMTPPDELDTAATALLACATATLALVMLVAIFS